jgi:hypothetical protein
MDADGSTWTKTIWIPEINDRSKDRVAKLKRELSLEDRAAEDAHHNLPPQSDKTLNPPQLDICSKIFEEILFLNEFLASEIGKAIQAARPLMPPPIDVEAIEAQIGSAAQETIEKNERDLRELCREDLQAQSNLRYFRYKHDLENRPADINQSIVNAVALIFAMFLVESVVNGSLFSQVLAEGLLGGAIYAGGISAANIALGIAAGNVGWRFAGHRETKRKWIGAAFSAFLHAAAIGFNIYVAHFRDAAEAAASSNNFTFDPLALKHATDQSIHDFGFFSIQSLPSLILLLLGLVVHFVAAIEGWKAFSDSYPGYKAVAVKASLAHLAYNDKLDELQHEARDAIEAAETDLKKTAKSARGCYEAISSLLDTAIQRRDQVRNSEDKCVADGTNLLRIYRERNIRGRHEGTTPPYFTVYPSADDYRRRAFGADLPPLDDALVQSDRIDAQIGEIQALRDNARNAADGMENAFKAVRRQAVAAIKSLASQIETTSKGIVHQTQTDLDNEKKRPPVSEIPVADATVQHGAA